MRDFGFRRSGATIAAALLIGLLASDDPAKAQDARPVKKDSRAQLRPKEASFTTAVEPTRARPGESVTYKVTAKLTAPWHIYKYAKTPSTDGPVLTSFDFFDPAGLAVNGDWTASKAPIKKKEPAFPDIAYLEYHEDEVTWSVKLTVPEKAAPGKKVLRCQAAYMICSDANCSFPGQWTLPDVELTILPASGSFASAIGAVVAPGLLLADPPRAAQKDTRPAGRPKAASFIAEIVPPRARAGETVSLKVTAKIDHPWHIYKHAKEQPEDGPKLTSFDLYDPAGLAPSGDWVPSRPPIKRKDNAFAKLEFLEFYEGVVDWSIPMTIPVDAPPGKRAVGVQIGFMICTDAVCSPPTRITLPAAEVEVVPGGPIDPATAQAAGSAAPNPTPITREPLSAGLRVGRPGLAVTRPDGPPPPPESPNRAGPAVASKEEPVAGGDIADKAREGIIPFLLACAAGGLLALAMPCVWPMVPVTVNFFVKQGQKNGGSATGLALAYCLSIILIFMGIGLIFSIFFGAASLSKLGNNPWINLGIAGIFLAFGLSLLGLFELRLPNALLNVSARGESKGGIVGVMFMASTLTITSFTCTFPVVGGLLGLAAKGDIVYPVIGMATFATVVALPFFLLALSPGLLARMPKSGDWMNTVKVVGGLVEIGAAFKFINTAECIYVVPSEAWFNAYAVLTIWVVLALICGIYLLGLFRTDHDHGESKVGAGRIVLGCSFLSLALFLAPALFGRPPQSKLWYAVVGLLPADAGNLRAPTGGGGSGGEGHDKAASSADPDKAEREQVAFHGVAWGMSLDGALERARSESMPVLIDFTGVNCANCRLMEQEVLPRDEVARVLARFVAIQLYTDVVPIKSISQPARIERAERNMDREIKLTGDNTNPNYVVLDPDGKVIGKAGGYQAPAAFVAFLEGAIKRFEGGAKVARAGGGG